MTVKLNTDSWARTLAEFRTHFPNTVQPDGGEFKSKNLMSPDILGYVKDKDGVTVEISTGWFVNHRIFGVTYASTSDKLSFCAHSWEEITKALC